MKRNFVQFKIKGQEQAFQLIQDLMTAPHEFNVKSMIRSLKIRFEDVSANKLREQVYQYLKDRREYERAEEGTTELAGRS